MKKIISVVLVFAMMLSLTAFAADLFTDVASDYWGIKYITEMQQRKVVNGYPEGDFKPENNVTRAEFAKMLSVISGKKLDDKAENTFTDVPADEWYVKYVNSVKSDFVTDNVSFRPEEDATREDVAAAIAKEVGKAFDASNLEEFKGTFSDSGDVSYMIEEDVADAYALKIIEGYPDGTFMPKANITRAEVCAMLCRAFPEKSSSGNGGSGNTKDDDEEEFIPDYYQFTVSTDKDEYSAGEDVVISVKINTMKYYAAAEYVLDFDPEFFDIDEGEDNDYFDEDFLGEYYDIPGSSFPGVIFPQINVNNGKLAVINLRTNGEDVSEENALSDVELLRVRFKVKENVSGETKIFLSKCKATNGLDKTRGSVAVNEAIINIK